MTDLRQHLLSLPGEYVKRVTMDWYYQLQGPVPIWIDWRNAKTDKVERIQFSITEVWPKCFFAGKNSRPFWAVIKWGKG